MYNFDSQIALGPEITGDFDTDLVKNEPMLYRADFEFAYDNGGELTHKFLAKLAFDSGHLNWSIDSKVAMLMKGWYPCIPGFHHDDVERDAKNFFQPNYEDASYRSKHAMMIVGDDVSRTRFALGKADFPSP
jgi:hypothetical protein